MKAELARVLPSAACCQRAELAAYIQTGVSADPAGRLGFETRSPAVARKLFLLCKQRLGRPARVQGVRGRSRRVYRVELPPTARHRWERWLRWRLPRRLQPCCRAAYLRGATLATGYLTEPSKGHHLEWVVASPDGVANLCRALADVGLEPKRSQRKGSVLIYLKDGEAIAEVLALIGAHHALLHFEDVRVLKGVRNRVNRLVNAETANVDKAVTAALRQREAIRALEEQVGLHRLPASLRAVAEARVAYPYASLRELGERLDPPLTKSAVGHRMRQLLQLAESVTGGKGAPGQDAGDGDGPGPSEAAEGPPRPPPSEGGKESERLEGRQ